MEGAGELDVREERGARERNDAILAQGLALATALPTYHAHELRSERCHNTTVDGGWGVS